MNNDDIRKALLSLADERFRTFSLTVLQEEGYPVIGVRIPEIRKLARQFAREEGLQGYDIIADESYEQVLIKGFVIGYSKTPLLEKKIYIDDYLKLADGWSLIDSFVSTVKLKDSDRELMWSWLLDWMKSEKPYVIRFVLVMMMNNYLDDQHIDQVIDYCRQIRSDHYYVRMANAWLLATAAINHYDKVCAILDELDEFTRNKTIQKAIESYRIDDEKKKELRGKRKRK